MSHKNLHDLTGKHFDNFKVLERAENSKNGHTRWLCECYCGCKVVVLALSLMRGTSTRCMKCASIKRSKHMMSFSKTYSVWVQMRERCHTPTHKYYPYYGGRGIRVCPEWRSDFSKFLEDMGEAPLGLSIERIDNEKGYSPENCKWETKENQQRNRRNAIHIGDIYNGWVVKSRVKNVKKYILQCEECKTKIEIWCCNVRKKHKCECTKRSLTCDNYTVIVLN